VLTTGNSLRSEIQKHKNVVYVAVLVNRSKMRYVDGIQILQGIEADIIPVSSLTGHVLG